MVARLSRGALLLILLPQLLRAEIQLQLPMRLEQGRVVQAELLVSGEKTDLQQLSLAPLQSMFRIEELGEVQGSFATGQQRKLKLLPLQSGLFSLPQWQLAERQILAARDAATGEPIELLVHPPTESPWQRQQLAYEIEVLTPQRFIRLQPGEAQGLNWLLRLSPAQTELVQQNPRRYRHRYRLWLFPLQAGEQTLRLPPLSYLHDGVASHRFYPPPLPLTVRPLPAYLPASTQVGEVSLRSLSARFGLLRSGEHDELKLEIKAEGVPAELWSLVLPELQASMAIEPQGLRGELEETVSFDGVSSRYRLSLPYQTRASQFWSSQPLLLEYFVPQLGKRVTHQLALHTPWIISPLQGGLLLILLLAAGVWMARRGILLWSLQRQRATAYLQAWELVATASEAVDLRRAQGTIAVAEGWPRHLGVEAWFSLWQALIPERATVSWQQGMLQLCYRGREDMLPGLRGQMLGMLQARLGWRLYGYRLLARLRLL